MQNKNDSKKQVPHFLASGEYTDDELLRCENMVKFLGGVLISCKKEQFIISCTHIIVFTFNSSLKVMCGLASGKWLIKKEYINESYKKRKWLNEEDYEVPHFRNVAKHHRLRTTKLYESFAIYLESDDILRKKSLARVLSAGGAIIHNRKDLEKGNKVDLALCDVRLLESVKSVVGETIPILDFNYIKETIFSKHPPQNIRRYIFNKSTAKIGNKFKKKENNKTNSGNIVNPTSGVSIKTPRVIVKTEVPNGYKRLMDDYLINETSSSIKKINLSNDIEIVGEFCAEDCKTLNLKSIPGKSQTEPTHQLTDRQGIFANKSQEIVLLDPKEVLAKKDSVSKTTTDTVRKNDTSKTESEIHNNSVFNSNFKKLTSGKRVIVPIDFPRMSKLVSIFLGNMNMSQDYLKFFHTPVYDYPVGEVRELDPIESIFTTSSLDEEKIVPKRVGHRKINVLEKNENVEDYSEGNIMYIHDSLQFLRMKIQPDIIPSSDNIGTMFRQILKCPYRRTSDMALQIFKSLKDLHPPHDKKMRDYYWNIFEKTCNHTEETFTKFKGWHFVVIWLKDLFKTDLEEIGYNVFAMIEEFLQLFELDLVQYNKRPISVTSLLSYRLFWVSLNQNPSILNSEVKELIKMWIQASGENNVVLNKITRFLCLMLEMLWKWNNIENFFDLTTWPTHSSFMPLANEFLLQFRDVNAETLLKLVNAIPVPWQQFYLLSLAYRTKIDDSEVDVELTFPYLKSKLVEECELCTKEEKNEKFPHPVRIKFLTSLTVSYSHAMGVKFCKNELLNHLNRSIRTKEVISPSAQEIDEVSSLNRESTVSSTPGGYTNNNNSNNNNNNNEESKDENLVIKKVVGNIMKLFSKMSGYIKELNNSKVHCAHISDFNFSHAL